MTANQSATAAAAAKVSRVKKSAAVSHAKTNPGQTALPLPGPVGPEFGQMAVDSIIVLDQVRKEFDEDSLRELASDIAAHGVLQPLTVRRTEAGFVLVAGERRLRAAKLAQLESVPVLVSSIADEQHHLAQLAENIQRADLSLAEEADGIKLLYAKLGSVKAVGEKVHKSVAWVSKRLSLANGLGHYASSLMADGITEDLELLQTVDKLEKATFGSNATWALCEKIRKGEAGRTEAREALKRATTEKKAAAVDTTTKPEKKNDEFAGSKFFREWLKNPYWQASEMVDILFIPASDFPREKFDALIDHMKRLEIEMTAARTARDNLLQMAAKGVREKYGTIALHAAWEQYQREKRQ